MAVDAGSIYSEIRIALDKLKQDIVKAEIEFDKFGKSNKTQSENQQKNWEKSFKGFNLAGTAAIAAVTIAFKKAVSVFAETEQSMANVRAVTGASAEEFAKLEAAAEEAGRTTRFTASQSADALYYLGSAGFDATQSVEALNGVLTLAGATGSDLASTAETVASAISAFNLEARDAEKVSNIFAAAIGNSQATMEKLAVSMRYVAPVASSFNQSIEGTVGLLQILYNNGFEASQAGTALRSALADLANAASPANEKLKALGVSFNEINPQTNSYADIIDVLNAKVTDASDIMSIFGDRAGPALIKLIEAGREEIDKYTTAVTGTNAAAEQYAIQNDTLAGSIDKFKSALEGASNSLIKTLAPALRGLLDAGAAILNAFTKLPKTFQGLIAGFGSTALAIAAASKAMVLLGVSSTAALGPIGLVVAALAGIGVAMYQAGSAQREYNRTINSTYDSISKIEMGAADLATELAVLQSKTKLSTEEQKRQREIVETLKKLYPDLTEQVLLNARAVATQRIEQAKANKQALQDQVTTLQKLKVNLEKEQQNQRKQIEKEARYALNRSNQYLDYEVQKRRNAEFEKRFAAAQTVEDLIKLAKEYGASEEQIGLNVQYTTDKIKETDKAINDAQRVMSSLSGEIGTNTIKLAGLADELDNTRESAGTATLDLTELYKTLADLRTENNLGLIDEQELIKQSAGSYESFIKKAIESGEFTEEQLKLLVKEYKNYVDQIIAEEERKNNLSRELEQSRINRIEDDAEREQALFEFNLENRLDSLEEAGATEEQLAKEKADEVAAYEEKKTKESSEKQKAIRKQLANDIVSGATALISALNDIYQIDAQNEIDAINEKVKTGQLTEEEGEKQIAEIKYKAAHNEWKLKGLILVADIAAAIGKAVASAPWPLNLPAIGFATGVGIAQTAALSKSKPKPPKLASGAVILPKRGGVETIQAENGYPEVTANLGPEGTAVISELGRRVAEAGGGRQPIHTHVYLNGKEIAIAVSQEQRNKTVRT